MSEGILLLVLAYIALAALLILTLIATRLHLVLKVLLVLGVFVLYVTSYRGWQSSQGWPSGANPLPERFLLHASVTQEPDPVSGDSGHIFVWASDLSDGKPAAQPRAYRLDYTKTLHSDLEEALRNMRNGNVQLGRKKQVIERPDRPTDLTRLGERRTEIEIYSLPDPALPEK